MATKTRRSYPKQIILKRQQKVRSKRGAIAFVMHTTKRTPDGYKLYRLKYRMKLGGRYQTFNGNGLWTAEQILKYCKLKDGK